MAKLITIVELNIGTEKFIKQATVTKKKLDELRAAQKLLKKQGKESGTQFVRNEIEIKKLSKSFNTQKNIIISLGSPYAKLSAQLNKSRARAKDLAAEFGINSRQARAAAQGVNRLDRRLKKIDSSLGQSQRKVGGYTKAVRFLSASFLGLSAIIFGAIRAIRDMTRRIVGFDKTMVSLSAILNVTRLDVADLEKEIIKVASTSLKTSSEVAKLAETLVTLGKTKKEILTLLKPVNDLSIGLQSTSQEAGELLIKTLNAFGKGSDEASKFADIIAKMRTSTALDFEKIKDALGFLAPTARAAGISFERTGAILGVLVDNGIKASRSGRLMSSSFLKLASDGLTLEDALEKIRLAQDRGIEGTALLALSDKLLGKESSALGLILANNKDKLNDLTEAFENSAGTLDKLTKQQLTSLSAKFKILDSTFESFLLSLENGEGVFGRITKSIVLFTTNIISSITPQNKLSESIEKQRIQLLLLQSKIKDVNIPQKERVKLIKQIQKEYPNFLKNIDAETIKNDELSLSIEKINDNFINKIVLQRKDEDIEIQSQKTAERKIKQLKDENRLRLALIDAQENQNIVIDENLTLLEQAQSVQKQLNDIREESFKGTKRFTDESERLRIIEAELLFSTAGLRASTKLFNQESEKSNKIISERIALEKKIRIEKIISAKDPSIITTKELTDEEIKLLIDASKRELEIFDRTNQAKIDSNKFFSEEILQQEKDRLNKIAQANIEHQKVLLANGEISQLEFNQAIEDINFDNRVRIEEADAEREEAKKEKDAEDLINKQIFDEENFLSEFEIRQVRLDQERALELSNIEKTGANSEIINKKFNLRQKKLDESVTQFKKEQNQQILNSLANLFGKSSLLGKAFAIAEIINTTVTNATKAFAQAAVFASNPLTLPLAVNARIQGAIIVATGAAQVAKTVVFDQGGQVPQGSGGKISGQNIPTQQGGDNIFATVKSGEVILNEQQQERAGGSAFFRSIGVPGFQAGGQAGTPISTPIALPSISQENLAESIAEKINDIKIVAIESDITDAQNLQIEIENGAII